MRGIAIGKQELEHLFPIQIELFLQRQYLNMNSFKNLLSVIYRS